MYVFEWLYCTHISFFSIDHRFCLYAQVSVFSNIDQVLSINLSANVFVFGDFNIHLKDWLTYSGGTDRPASTAFTQMVKSPTRISDYDSYSPALLDFFLLTLLFFLQWLSFHCEMLIMLLFQYPLAFYQTQNRLSHFIAQLMTILVLIRMVFVII